MAHSTITLQLDTEDAETKLDRLKSKLEECVALNARLCPGVTVTVNNQLPDASALAKEIGYALRPGATV
jgi:hypothetical protein